MPRHIAIIMDGNGRWAKNRSLARSKGHKKGAEVVREITKFCAKSNLECLTLYAFSTENWSRPKREVNFLMKLLENFLKKEEKTYLENNLKFCVIGDRTPFSKTLQNLIFNLEQKTKNNSGLTQVLALNYGGKNEISRAVLRGLNQTNGGIKNLDSSAIEHLIEDNLDTKDFPPLDMLIRTGGEFRLSNFLLWQSAYAELFFTPTLFPDFNISELVRMFEEFKSRNRRFGGL